MEHSIGQLSGSQQKFPWRHENAALLRLSLVMFSWLRRLIWLKHLGQALRRIFIRLRNLYLQRLRPLLSPLYALSGVLSLAVLITEFGFYYPTEWQPFVQRIALLLILFMVVYEILSLVFSDHDWRSRLRIHRLQLLVITGVLLQLFYREPLLDVILNIYGFTPREAALLLLVFTQVPLLFSNLLHLLRRAEFSHIWHIHPALIFVVSFLLIIAIGTALLSLPKAHVPGISFVDLFFTAVSAVCVTGLTTIDVSSQLTLTGQIILLGLIQLGGLGLMTLTAFFSFYLTGRSSVTNRLAMRDLLSEDSLVRVKSLIRNIALITFLLEAIGAIFLFISSPAEKFPELSGRIFHAVFHAVSAFCNAGFSLNSDSLAAFAVGYENYLVTIILLIVFGGLGFPVISEIMEKIIKRELSLSVTTRIVLGVNGVLLLVGTLGYFFLEQKNTLLKFNTSDQLLNSFFYSVTTRTAGFNTTDTSSLTRPMAFLTLVLMYIGASPGSTGGGIKTSTFAVALLNVFAIASGRNRVDIFHRSISTVSIHRANSVIILSMALIFSAAFILTITEEANLMALLFETVSAFATVGLSMGITPELSLAGKLVLCFVMLAGRVGVFTFLTALLPKEDEAHYRYPTEYVVVG